MRYLLPLFVAVLLVGCSTQSDVTIRAKGDGLMIIGYTIDGQYSETSAVGSFEQSYTGSPPESFTVILTDEGGVICEIVVNGSIVASDTQSGLAAMAQCKQ